ncbi:MAG: DNA-binding protein [Vulcanimicrobiota bacterium]
MADELIREAPTPYRVGTPGEFQAGVLQWAVPAHLREFPWRHTQDPYRLLLSELMLRRTQARQVAPTYKNFFQRWPNLESFLQADTGELGKVLLPLGLQWRIQNILDVREALRDLGRIPQDYQGLIGLPGVGDYVASAVLCFSLQEARPLIDTNTVRLIGRYFGLQVHQGTRRLRSFRQLAASLVPQDNTSASVYHYGLLDLAATICRPTHPVCSECPLSSDCQTLKNGRTSVHFSGT